MKSELNREYTLGEIAEYPGTKELKLTYGVVIDVTEPIKYEDKHNYITKLKIIDPTFNYKAEIKNKDIKFHKFVHVSIFTNNVNSAPKIKHVGDIIRLRRFNFKLSERGELVAIENKFANWLVYDGNIDANEVSSSFKKFDKNVNRKLNEFESSRLRDLRKWNDSFFYQNSIKYITWWTELNNPDESEWKGKSYEESQVDLLLKTTKINAHRKSVEFTDLQGNTYRLELQAKPALKPNQVIKLRCVNLAVTKKLRKISLTKNTSCLIVPQYFYDYRCFRSKTGGKREKLKSFKGENLATKYKFLGDYDYQAPGKGRKKNKGPRQISVIKKLTSKVETTSVATLLKYLKKPSKYQGKKFVIDGYIVGFLETNPRSIIKYLDLSTKKTYDFSDGQPKNTRKSNLRVIYHLITFVKDKSVEYQEDYLNLYILTTDAEQKLFDLWGLLPASNSHREWKNVSLDTLTNFSAKLVSLKDPENRFKAVVELMTTKNGKAFYKLCDTVFLPL
jgi:hypothetical protein